MGAITLKELSEIIDIGAIEKNARSEWDKQQKSRRRIEQSLIALLPFGLLIMTAIFYGLSAPHTASILRLITPDIVVFGAHFNVGDVSPVGWELGVLIVAALIEAGWNARLTHGLLWTLLGLSIVINVAGAFIAVVSGGAGADISRDTMLALMGRFGELPATYQVVLLLVTPIGIVIPIVAKLTGEGVVKLAMGKVKLERESSEERWAKEAARVMHSALLQEAMRRGAGTKTAGNWALAAAKELYRWEDSEPITARGQHVIKPTVSGFAAFVPGQSDSPGQSHGAFVNQSPIGAISAQVQKDASASPDHRLTRRHVRQWLQDNSERVAALNDRDRCRLYTQEQFSAGTETGYKTFERARKDLEQS